MTDEATPEAACRPAAGSPEPSILTERSGGVLTIVLNRPAVRNAIDGDLARSLAAAADELDEDPGLMVGVLTGAGGYFCAGMDLGAFVNGDTPILPDRGFGGIAERPPRKPLIAAIEGFAVAGGLELALACDLIVCARGAKMGLPETRRALVAMGGALLRLPRRMPYHIVMELALTGELFPAERFHEFGVVNRLVEPGEALATAIELATTISRNGPLAVAASKSILAQQFDWSQEDSWSRQAVLAEVAIDSHDAREGALAFKERRDPAWQGR
jgi:enoyl-CoA hydratase